jgi:hypothetical protein
MSAPRLVSLSAKCSDMCYTTIIDQEGNEILEGDGYVPNIKGIGGGDYLSIKVDNATGKIVGWVPVTEDDIKWLAKDI